MFTQEKEIKAKKCCFPTQHFSLNRAKQMLCTGEEQVLSVSRAEGDKAGLLRLNNEKN